MLTGLINNKNINDKQKILHMILPFVLNAIKFLYIPFNNAFKNLVRKSAPKKNNIIEVNMILHPIILLNFSFSLNNSYLQF
jgi:hypothetical protein